MNDSPRRALEREARKKIAERAHELGAEHIEALLATIDELRIGRSCT